MVDQGVKRWVSAAEEGGKPQVHHIIMAIDPDTHGLKELMLLSRLSEPT